MPTKLQRYEAVVKLSTGQVVQYHNINTGLLKFHRFVEDKFGNGKAQTWTYYKVRRIETKEEVGKYINATEDKSVKAIKMFVENEPNATGTGFVFLLPFVRGEFVIQRKLFVANSQVLERNNDFILISEWLFGKMIKEAKNSLYEFYKEKGHQITTAEIELGSFPNEKVLIVKKGKEGIYPHQDYP